MPDTLQYLQSFLNNNIPLARSMQIQALDYGNGAITLGAPLRPNSNHHGTGFGGSIASLGVVAGWALIHLLLRETGLNTQLVIRKTECDFLAPARTDFEAYCSVSDGWDEFQARLASRGKARLELTTEIRCEGEVIAQLSSSYAALLEPAD